MVSLLHLAEITEQGVNFESPRDRARMLLTPEASIGIQNRLGASIPVVTPLHRFQTADTTVECRSSFWGLAQPDKLPPFSSVR